VITGLIPKVLKSEPLPKIGNDPVRRVVGSNVLDIVATPDTDVLLVVVVPSCAQCKKLLPTIDLLGRAVHGEPRILVAKIDGASNDLPATWNIKNYPALLWFPGRDKPYKNHSVPIPRPYWDAGFSLQELTSFVQRDSSFDAKTLRVATSEQLGSLLGSEDMLRAKYEEEERHQFRNEGRQIYELPVLDWLLGEVVFDGKRWHLGVTGLLAITWMVMLAYIIGSQTAKKVVKKRKAQ
jgi:thiol-disulfide isomerase/thioredoxin